MADPIPTVDLALDVDTNDLVFTARNLTLVTEEALVAQRLKVLLQLFLGEWFLDANAGIPYFQEILKKGVDPTNIDAIFRAAIVGVKDVNRIIEYASEIDDAARTVSVAFTVDTVYGPVSIEGISV